MSQQLFGTDGIRDIANSGNLTTDKVLQIARTVGHKLRTNPQFFWHEGMRAPDRRDRSARGKSRGAGKVAIGVDTRISGPLICAALEAGLLSQGVDILNLGVIPTPVVASMTNVWGCILGIVISASHNSMEYNGIKLFNARGLKLPRQTETKLEAEILSGSGPMNFPIGDRIGRKMEHDDFLEDYLGLITRQMAFASSRRRLTKLKIVVDGANGAASEIAPRILRELGAKVVAIHCTPDGRNINRNCGALYPQVAAEVVRTEKAHLGISLDGDADRAILLDEQGNTVDGDFMMAIAAGHLKQQAALPGDLVVGTVMSNLCLELYLKQIGVQLLRTPVGDQYVLEKMIDDGYVLGGEQSGHLIFLDTASTGDGLVTSLKMIDIMLETGKKLSELASVMSRSPQILLNVPVSSRPELESVPAIRAQADQVRSTLGDDGRLVLRYSGTETLARVMIEGLDEKQINKLAESLADVIRKELG